jgi:soluble lytic murein transglycosylase-like protein
MIADAPALPPYGFLDASAMRCIAEASEKWEVPELLIHAVASKEGGKPGTASRNNNGTYDLGPAQINTSVWETFFRPHGIEWTRLRDDVCFNFQAATWLLKRNYEIKGRDWQRAVVAYHIGPNNWDGRPNAILRGTAYASHVFSIWTYLHGYAGEYARSSYTK